MVRELLSRPGVDVTTKADGEFTPLEIALEKGHSEVVSILQEYSQGDLGIVTGGDRLENGARAVYDRWNY